MNGLSTAILADAARTLGLERITVDYQPAHRIKTPVTGRARTLALRSLLPDEVPGGIHEALQTYKFMNRGDFIVVERNDDSSTAYFGSLNAALAHRAGVKGVAVDGATRDTHAFPTWARSRTPRDCGMIASVESYDQPIEFGGVKVRPGALVIGDWDGIAFVDTDIESELMFEAQKLAQREIQIESLIWSGWEIDSIVRECGGF